MVEQGRPEDLAACPDSVYRSLLESAEGLHASSWGEHSWRRTRVQGGRLLEGGQP